MKIKPFITSVLLFVFTDVIAQSITSEYKVSTEGGNFPVFIDRSKIQLRVKTYCDTSRMWIRSYRQDAQLDDTVGLYIDKREKKILQFDNRVLTGAFILKTDTLLSTSIKQTKASYTCNEYILKDHPDIKIYATEKLDRLVNPGINYHYANGNIGGIVAVEINLKGRSIKYELLSTNPTKPLMVELEACVIQIKTARASEAKSILPY